CEPAERERSDDEALKETPHRHQNNEGDDDPVDRGHDAVTLRVGGPAFRVRSGGLAVTDHERERRRRITHRFLPALAGIALVVGLVVGSMGTSASVRAGRDFARAWERGKTADMYALLTDEAKQRYSYAAFTNAYRRDAM